MGKDPRECFMCVAFDTWVKRLTQTCSVPPDIKREETNTKGSNIKSFRLWTIGHRTFYGYVLCLILGIDMFSDTATRILSLSQRPFTTQFGKGCCVSTSTKTPRKRTTYAKFAAVVQSIKNGIQNQIPRSISTCQLQNALLHFYFMPIKRLVLP